MRSHRRPGGASREARLHAGPAWSVDGDAAAPVEGDAAAPVEGDAAASTHR
jgi:hypothetical protein